jgi:hypothetical protein
MIATNLSIEPGDFAFPPFLVAPKPREGGAQRGGPGNLSAVALSQPNGAKVEAHQPACPPKRRRRQILRSFSEVGLFGEQLPKLLDELNEGLAA